MVDDYKVGDVLIQIQSWGVGPEGRPRVGELLEIASVGSQFNEAQYRFTWYDPLTDAESKRADPRGWWLFKSQVDKFMLRVGGAPW